MNKSFDSSKTKRLASCDFDRGTIRVFSQYTPETLIEYQASPDNAVEIYNAIEVAVRKAEEIAYREAKRTLGMQIVNNLLGSD